jgi:hypothetical protein
MSEAMPTMPEETTSSTAGSDDPDSITEVKDRVIEGAKDKTGEVRQQARTKITDELDRRSTEVGQQLGSVGGAVSEAAKKLREDGNGTAADLTERAADGVGRFATYLEHANGSRMLQDAEDFARRQPLVAAAAGVLVGLIGARFLKASSARRYEARAPEAPAAGRAGGAPVTGGTTGSGPWPEPMQGEE